MPGKYAALVLSRGEWYQPRPIRPREVGADSWPTDATVRTDFYDSHGGTINTLPGIVAADGITWDVAPEEVDIIPAGAQFETILTTVDGKAHQIQYGAVIRKQAHFAVTGSSLGQGGDPNLAKTFGDNFYNRTGLVGSKWIPLLGKPTIFDNTDPEPNGVGPKTVFFTDAAMRYFKQLNTDSWVISFNVLNPGPGKTAIFGASSASANSYLYAMFETGLSTNKVHMGIGSGPIAMADQVPSVNHTVPGSHAVTNYKLRYDDDTKLLALFLGDATSPLISFTDSDHLVPHGNGYRYFGVNWQASLLSSGVQLTSIKAQDSIDA